MNHLEEAKKMTNAYDERPSQDTYAVSANLHALIAIAEQEEYRSRDILAVKISLEKIAKQLEKIDLTLMDLAGIELVEEDK